jgi:hypothetical protein
LAGNLVKPLVSLYGNEWRGSVAMDFVEKTGSPETPIGKKSGKYAVRKLSFFVTMGTAEKTVEPDKTKGRYRL